MYYSHRRFVEFNCVHALCRFLCLDASHMLAISTRKMFLFLGDWGHRGFKDFLIVFNCQNSKLWMLIMIVGPSFLCIICFTDRRGNT